MKFYFDFEKKSKLYALVVDHLIFRYKIFEHSELIFFLNVLRIQNLTKTRNLNLIWQNPCFQTSKIFCGTRFPFYFKFNLNFFMPQKNVPNHRLQLLQIWNSWNAKKNCIEILATMVRSCNKNFVWCVWNHIRLLDMVAKKGQIGYLRWYSWANLCWRLEV